MAEKNKNDNTDYFIDVARDHIYQNQGKEYTKAFTEWRNDEKNPYGYAFIHDSREHTYVDGEGYADEFAVTSEKETLHRCFKVAGIAMLILIGFQTALSISMKWIFGAQMDGWVYYSERSSLRKYSFEQITVYCAIKIIAYLSVILFCALKLRLPRKVYMPNEQVSRKKITYAVCVSLIFMVIARFFDYLLVKMFYSVNIDMCFYRYVVGNSPSGQYFYIATELLIVPILSEIIFRGFFLQLFRQFGDTFAVIFSSILASCCFHDISKLMYMFFFSVILATVTIKTGSLFTSMIARIIVVDVTYVLNDFSVGVLDYELRFREIIVCIFLLVVCTCIITYLQEYIITPRNRPNSTEITLADKLRLVLNSNYMIVWLLLSLFETILAVRIV